MRNERVIANEIEERRAHLEHDLGELRTLVDDKLEVVRRAREKVDSRRKQLMDARDSTRQRIEQNPLQAVGAALAVGALLGFIRGR